MATPNVCREARIAGGEPSPADDVAELRSFAADGHPGEPELAFPNTDELFEARLRTR